MSAPNSRILTLDHRFASASRFISAISNIPSEYLYAVLGKTTIWKIDRYIIKISQTNPVVITSNNHGFVNGDEITISGVVGMTEMNSLPGPLIVSNATTNTFELSGVNSTTYSSYISGGVLTKNIDTAPLNILDNTNDEMTLRNNLFGGIRVIGSDMCLVIPRYNWITSTVYDKYDSNITNLNTKQFYVITDEDNVYICLDNVEGSISTIKPTGRNLLRFTTADQYVWKYLFTVSSADKIKFMDANWIPVRELEFDNASDQWDVQTSASKGTIDSINIVTAGSGYVNNENITVTIIGNGSGATAEVPPGGLTAGAINRIVVTNPGLNYTNAVAVISTSDAGIGAFANINIAPSEGHGSNPARELFARNVMIVTEFNADESGKLSVTNDFRELALIRALKTKNEDIITASSFDFRITLNLSSITGTFLLDEVVTGGTTGAKGTIVDVTGSTITVIASTKDFFATEGLSSTGGATAIIASIINSTADIFSGDVIYHERRTPITRNISNSELFKTVFSF